MNVYPTQVLLFIEEENVLEHPAQYQSIRMKYNSINFNIQGTVSLKYRSKFHLMHQRQLSDFIQEKFSDMKNLRVV